MRICTLNCRICERQFNALFRLTRCSWPLRCHCLVVRIVIADVEADDELLRRDDHVLRCTAPSPSPRAPRCSSRKSRVHSARHWRTRARWLSWFFLRWVLRLANVHFIKDHAISVASRS